MPVRLCGGLPGCGYSGKSTPWALLACKEVANEFEIKLCVAIEEVISKKVKHIETK
ncbi:MAG: hypothetical protein H3Z52_15820 [archaeon]|nr:hypothetical protein [archaeon]